MEERICERDESGVKVRGSDGENEGDDCDEVMRRMR